MKAEDPHGLAQGLQTQPRDGRDAWAGFSEANVLVMSILSKFKNHEGRRGALGVLAVPLSQGAFAPQPPWW